MVRLVIPTQARSTRCDVDLKRANTARKRLIGSAAVLVLVSLAPASAAPLPSSNASPLVAQAVSPKPAPGERALAPGASPAERGTAQVVEPPGRHTTEIRFGMTAPLSGPSKDAGRRLSMGVQAAFEVENEAGGVHGRKLKLVTSDDGYEPSRTLDAVKRLRDKDGVLGMVASYGTPTASAALPYALEQRMLFFGAFTGANILRSTPPDRYVFNYRPSYAEETEATVRYLVQVRGLKPADIVVFAQDDAFGNDGYAGVVKALRAIQKQYVEPPLRLNYKRNTVDVTGAVQALRARKIPPRAVIMVAAYRPAAKFIEVTRPLFPNMIYTNVSFVGSSSLAEELRLLGPRFSDGVIVTQVVPAVNGYSKAVLDFKDALGKYFPGEAPDYVSFEGYIAAKILTEGVKRAGPGADVEKLVDALEGMNDFDLGLGTPLKFLPTEHQASHMIWGTQLDREGRYRAIDLR